MSSKLKVNNIIPSTGTQIGISTTGGGINLLTGTVVTGIVTAREGIFLPDSKTIKLGNTAAIPDFTIEHNGSNGIIDTNTGDLILRSDADDIKILAEDDIVLRDNDDSTNFIHCINGAGVKLYNAGNERLETTGSGIDVTGSVVADDLIVTGTSVVGDFKSTNNNYVLGLAGNNSSVKAYFGTDSSGNFKIATGSGVGERFNIDTAGQATHTYDISDDGDAGLILNTDDGIKAPSILFRANSENRARLDVKRRSGDGGIVTLQVSRADNSNNLVNVFTSQCATSGDTTPDLTLGGNLVLANGHGIDFSATSGTGQSELLDDYEEGEFNPVVSGSTSAGTGSNSAIEGHYTKIGNLVHVDIYVNQTSHNGTGDVRISTPYTCKSGAQVVGAVMFDSVNFNDDYRTIAAHIWGGSSLIGLYGTRDDAVWSAVPMSGNLDSSVRYILSITFPVA